MSENYELSKGEQAQAYNFAALCRPSVLEEDRYWALKHGNHRMVAVYDEALAIQARWHASDRRLNGAA